MAGFTVAYIPKGKTAEDWKTIKLTADTPQAAKAEGLQKLAGKDVEAAAIYFGKRRIVAVSGGVVAGGRS